MAKQYSIAEARDHLPRIVHEVEDGGPVELTRRGKPVAVVVSIRDYERKPRRGRKKDFWEALVEWRAKNWREIREANLGPEYFDSLRDRSPGRDWQWPED